MNSISAETFTQIPTAAQAITMSKERTMNRSRQKRFQFSGRSLLSAGAVALVLLWAPLGFADTETGSVCMGTLFGNANNGAKLNCTANDITIARATSVSVASCFEGSRIDFTATFQTELSGGGSKQTRYDVGYYFDIDGDPEGDGARGGRCTVAVAQTGETGFLDLDQDVCGDINAANNPLFPEVSFTDVLCHDSDGDGFVNLPNCTSWRQPGANEDCQEATDAFPGTSSKCNCDDTFNIPIRVEPADATVTKAASKACVTFDVTVENPTTTKSVTLTDLDDDIYGDITDSSNTKLCSTTCSVPQTIGPGSSYPCSFTADVKDSSAPQINIVTATLGEVVPAGTPTPTPFTRQGQDTIDVNLHRPPPTPTPTP